MNSIIIAEESPLEFYVRRAAELGISRELLFPSGQIGIHVPRSRSYRNWDRGDFGRDSDVGGPLASLPQDDTLFSIYSALYDSTKNGNGVKIRAWQELNVELENDSTTGLRIQVSHQEYGFLIFNLWPSKKANVSISIKDSKITTGESEPGRPKTFPQDQFEVGKDYQPALDWMLQQYANGTVTK